MVLVWTLTLKNRNSAKIGHVFRDRFFPLKHLDRSRYGSWYNFNLWIGTCRKGRYGASRVLCSVKHLCYLITNHHRGRNTRRNKDVACWIEWTWRQLTVMVPYNTHTHTRTHTDYLNSVSSHCTCGKSSIARKKLYNHLDFTCKFYLNNKIFPHMVQC